MSASAFFKIFTTPLVPPEFCEKLLGHDGHQGEKTKHGKEDEKMLPIGVPNDTIDELDPTKGVL